MSDIKANFIYCKEQQFDFLTQIF